MKGKKTQSLPPMERDDGSLSTDPSEKAEILNDQFIRQTQINAETDPTPLLQKLTINSLTSIEITIDDVKKVMKTVDKSKAQGPDEIHPYIIHECQNELAYPVWKLFQMSIEREELPIKWKQANITPIYKKGDKAKPVNYRPIALTSCICKLLEKIIHKHLLKFSWSLPCFQNR